MKSTRQKISNLKNKITENLPNDNDIFGYAGINKRMIIESLNESYDILSVIEPYNDKFETIFAKRKISKLIESANHYLNDIFQTKEGAQKFNDFLNCIAKIRFSLKEAYLTLTSNTLKLESEIVSAKEALDELTNDLLKIKSIKDEIELIKNESSDFINELEQKHKLSIENEDRINKFSVNIESIDEELKGTNEKINIWKTEIQTIKDEIVKKQADFVKLKTETEQIQSKNKDTGMLADKFAKTLEQQLNTNSEQQEYIQQTIEDVSRAGMAGSFKKRKDELRWSQLVWALLTVFSVGGLIWLSYSIVIPFISGQEVNLNHLIIKIPVFASAVWLGWFCSKQYGFTTRIREDYAYKYAISLAFEGYKNETREIDNELLQKLIQLTIFNISKSPVSIFDTKNNHGSPYNEILDNVVKRFFGDKNKSIDDSK